MTARLRYALCALVLGGTLIAGGAQAQAADQTHKGSGGFNTTGFYTHGTRLEYHFGWRCSAFHTMHLELQRHVYRPIGPDTWETDKMLVEHDGHEGERHNHHYISPGFNWGGGPALYRLAVRTSPQCHWELHFTY